MSNWSLPPCSTLVIGMTGSGKTTFCIQYLLNVSAACRFIFDETGQMAARLRVRPAATATELEQAVPTRWVIFNPHRMFPGNAEAGFNYFCQWAYDVSQRGPGKKILLVEELWRYSTSHKISTELATVAQMGRAEELELVINTQLPHKINGSIIGQATEAVCFRLQSDLALDCVRTELEISPAAVRDLPLGTFIARNRLSGATEQAALW